MPELNEMLLRSLPASTACEPVGAALCRQLCLVLSKDLPRPVSPGDSALSSGRLKLDCSLFVVVNPHQGVFLHEILEGETEILM